MKKKYIIALEDRNVWSCGFPAKTLLLSDVSIFGTDLASVNTGIELTPYTEPDLEQVRKEAYDKGLIDAWECAKKIQDTGGNLNWWIHNTSASEAIEKIRQYRLEKEEQIQVGDEVIATSGKAVIVSINDDKNKARYIYHDSTLGFDKVCNLSKTGRHFPEIAAVLEKMRGEEE